MSNTRLRILFLDDSVDRHRVFARNAVGCQVDPAYTAQQAIDLLSQNEVYYDLVFLDHDLGGPESEGLLLDDVADGRFVTRWIEANASRFGPTTFIVHSLNEPARVQMVKMLDDADLVAYAVPFAWTKFRYRDGEVSFQ